MAKTYSEKVSDTDTEALFFDEKVIRSCFYRNKIPGFSIAVALSASVETRSMASQRKSYKKKTKI